MATRLSNLAKKRAYREGAHLEGARLKGKHLEHAHLEDVHLNRAFLNGVHLERAHLNGADLSDAKLHYANLNGADLREANLYHADLYGADLSGANLTGANLDDADLERAHLEQDAHLDGADLSEASLKDANLTGAHLDGAFLIGANLNRTHLRGADLNSADLRRACLNGTFLPDAHLIGAHLEGADLRSADLNHANLSQAHLDSTVLSHAHLEGADLSYAYLTGATYAPQSKPPDPYVVDIHGLSTLKVPTAPPDHEITGQWTGLVQLRKLLEDAGLEDDSRAATYSIQKAVTAAKLKHPGTFAWFEGIGRYVGFDLTTSYGLRPTRALLMIAMLGGVLTLVYMWPILKAPKHPPKASGIYQVFPAGRIEGDSPGTTVDKEPEVIRVQSEDWWSAFKRAAYFSLLSAVNIGFEQFTPGDWIQRMQSQEYTLKAVGWVRVVAGAQSVLSVYLLAMWALTQFGRPFG